MQTLGLTMATAVTDAGAESATQTNVAAPSNAGAIFEILMTSPSEPAQPTDAGSHAAFVQIGTATLPVEASTSAPVTQMPVSDLAGDMEHLVQALAITAEVVAQGMAARTNPVREIILTVETPPTDVTTPEVLPPLSVALPTDVQPRFTLKISEADPATNLDPQLIAMLPQVTPDTTESAQIDDVVIPSSETEKAILPTISEADNLTDLPDPQAELPHAVEAYGPWRAEIYGPLLNAQSQLITQPVHVPVFETPETIATITSSVIATVAPSPNPEDVRQDLSQPLEDEFVRMQTAQADMPIRVVTISVPMKAQNLVSKDSVEHEEPIHADIRIATSDIKHPIESQGPKTIEPQADASVTLIQNQITPAMIQAQPTQIESVAANQSQDVLNAPRYARPQNTVLIVIPAAASETTTNKSRMQAQTAPAQTQVVSSQSNQPPQYFDVGAVVETLHRDAEVARLAHHPDDVRISETFISTNIADSVAKTSSRSKADIRDLMKTGVREIEIVQGNGRDQTMLIGPQMQSNELSGTAAGIRAQVAEGFVPSGQEANTAERRAQAHEIRMRAIERQVIAAVRDGADTIRMQLYPPGLGQIIIRITMDGSKMKLTTSANSSDAADSLRSIEGDLRDALSIGGLELTGFDVSEDGERGDENRKPDNETENETQHSCSAKSEDFALDMNA